MAGFSIGQLVGGRYRLDSVLARGGMGAVYRATDERIGRTVAVKVLLSELATDTTEVARFQREATAVASLHHPGIVQVLDVGREGDSAFLVMEHIAGRTIADVLGKEGKLDPQRAADIAEQALFAISVAHGAGIVHRDLKPGNLMLVPTGGREMVKVLDFGVAQLKTGAAYTRLTQTGAIVGTPAYMAPEQAHGDPCDGRTDVYAMGVLLWCMLTGKKPFTGTNMGEILVKVLEEVPQRADRVEPTVPAALAGVCDVALQKRPENRFASASAFATALVELRTRAVAPNAAPNATPPSPSSPARTTDPRHAATLLTTSGQTVPPHLSGPPRLSVPPRVSVPPHLSAPSPPMAYAPSPAPGAPNASYGSTSASGSSGFAAPPVALSSVWTRELVTGAIAVLATALVVGCMGSAYVLRQWSLGAPASPSLTGIAPGSPDSMCERAVRCCGMTTAGAIGCERLRTYESMGADGEAICRQLLTSYEQSASIQRMRCQ